MIAGRGGDHRAPVAAFATGDQRIQGATHLVGTGALQILQLQPAAEALGMVQRRGRQVATQAGLRRQHVVGARPGVGDVFDLHVHLNSDFLGEVRLRDRARKTRAAETKTPHLRQVRGFGSATRVNS